MWEIVMPAGFSSFWSELSMSLLEASASSKTAARVLHDALFCGSTDIRC